MANFNLADYEQVQDRIPKFYGQYESGRITTQLIEWGENGVIVKAFLYADAEQQEKKCPLATGYAQEKPGAGYVNKTSPLENCETSAIGRALANIGLHGDKRASREEMEKVQRAQQPKEPIIITDKEYLQKCRKGLSEALKVPAEYLERELEIIRQEQGGNPQKMYQATRNLYDDGACWDDGQKQIVIKQ